MSNLIGQSLGRYHILEQLGEGGMAIVYKAYDTRLESDVAVKVIRTENLAPSILGRALKRFEREAKALAKLTHSNIVKVLDYGEYEGKPYLVMPYLPGGTLKERLQGKPMAYQEATQILIPVSRALAYAHQQGLVHRDVKPSNILITQSGDPMLTDFGIAKIIDEEATMDLTGTSATVGTPEYMAPEQVVSKSVDHRADIYALGVVFYEMVTGRKPFMADTPMAVLFKHASEPLPRPKNFVPSLPDAVEHILLKALAKRPEDRYQGMGELVHALESLLSGVASTVKPQPLQPVQPVRLRERTLDTQATINQLEDVTAKDSPAPRNRSTQTIAPFASPGLLRFWPLALIGVLVVGALSIGLFAALFPPPRATAAPETPVVATKPPVVATEPPASGLPDLGGKTIAVAVENAYPPFNSIDQATGEGAGWDYDAVTEICKRLNCVPEFKEAAWDGIFPAMQAGEFDMLADGVTFTEERAKIVSFSTPYVEVNQYLLVRADETRTIEEMKADANAKIGTQIGTTNEIAAKSYFTGKEIQSFEDFGAAVLALKSNDIDGVVIDNIAAAGFMKENEGAFKLAGQIATGETLAFVFPPNSDLTDAVNAALAAMTADGTLEQLNKKWGLIP